MMYKTSSVLKTRFFTMYVSWASYLCVSSPASCGNHLMLNGTEYCDARSRLSYLASHFNSVNFIRGQHYFSFTFSLHLAMCHIFPFSACNSLPFSSRLWGVLFIRWHFISFIFQATISFL